MGHGLPTKRIGHGFSCKNKRSDVLSYLGEIARHDEILRVGILRITKAYIRSRKSKKKRQGQDSNLRAQKASADFSTIRDSRRTC